MQMKQPVAHYSDGRNAWNLGFVGGVIRIRGIAIAGLVTLITMGAPWWWPDNTPTTIEFSVKSIAGFFAITVSVVIILLLIYLRKRIQRSLNMKYQLHRLTHDVRDRQTAMHSKLVPTKSYSKGKLTKELELMLAEICANLSDYFKELIRDDTITVSIRLAVPDKTNGIAYKTFARSKGLNQNRSKHSEPIPANEGIPRFLRDEKNSQGVLFYYDLIVAAQSGAYKFTKNDTQYPEDISTMMVAPLNAFSGSKQDMIGILYVASRNQGVFKVSHVDSMAFVADHTAMAIANIIELVRLKCNTVSPIGGGVHA
ncbi:MAG: hypothetical protein PHP85_03865 [Gallionella sp.]|nr:hypothetical protein [Gallionella sp.]